LLKKEVIKIKEQLENLNQQEIELQKKLKYIMFSIPNIPDQNVPLGKDENDNVELRK
jgi:seryl-tRNA synthetase